MQTNELRKQQDGLLSFVGQFQSEFARKDQLEQCLNYLSGLLLDGERKSVEPMASRLSGVSRQSMHHFVCNSPWNGEELQNQLWRKMLNALRVQERPDSGSVLILDDTGFRKKGNNSVGVSHQYFGLQAQNANCQVMVSWHYSHAASDVHLPVRGELYLPTTWTDDRSRMKKAFVPPEKRDFRTKWQIALELLDQFRSEIPHEAIVFDAGYGCVKELLGELDLRNERFVAAIPSTISFWPGNVVTHASSHKKSWWSRPSLQVVTNKKTKPMQGWQWHVYAKNKNSKICHWRTFRLDDSKHTRVRATAMRVRERGHNWQVPEKERWLIIEETGMETRYYVSNFPADTPLEKLIRLAHSRWAIEQGYQQLKEELGLDHYEGRSWPGFHHHVSLCFMAYDYLLLLQYQDSQKKAHKRATA